MRRPRRSVSQRSDLLHDLHTFSLNQDTREIMLTGESSDDGVNWLSANTFIKNLLVLNNSNHEPVLVHQCIGGGDWGYGMAVHDAILTSASPVVVLVHGHAESMSSIIPLAARKRIIMPNSHYMIHFGSNGYSGDSRSFIAEGEQAKLIDEQMLTIYTNVCHRGPFFRRNKYSRDRTKAYLRQRLNETREWYMTADESVDLGFMTGVFGSPNYKTLESIR